MFARDQQLAFRALFTFSPQAQDRYAEKHFAPNSEKQVTRLAAILHEKGYPGERIIGNNFWVETILSHHNSISTAYCRQDTMYRYLRPILLEAIKKGSMSPYEFALIDNWHTTINSDHKIRSYGYLNSLNEKEHIRADELRRKIGLRSVETRNALIDIQTETGMDFSLPDRPGKNEKIGIISMNQ